MMLYTWYELL